MTCWAKPMVPLAQYSLPRSLNKRHSYQNYMSSHVVHYPWTGLAPTTVVLGTSFLYLLWTRLPANGLLNNPFLYFLTMNTFL